MRHFFFAALLLGLPGSAAAQGAQHATEGLHLTVRPSGYEAEQNEAQRRQERLLKRLEQSNHMIRSICINCGDSWKHQIYEPFDPYASLKASARPPDAPVN
ncbi:hypothetical protein [Microvirga makkahensis]|uniref:Uncharacterized protein n=1 Tax=Microvirga makkahensis TaxID=1128670 RepID=A0A7X3MX02_9HYPH|nr:hypothetical protein [Microvirga makkahensis]MXQ14761.1 hypothetical protein [Microvirga makkahensis]